MAGINFDDRPILVFWESTKACLLACKHCRAEAMDALPGQLSTEEGLRFIDSLAEFGRPYPVLIITGGDVMMRSDVWELVNHANSLGIPVGLAPSVTPNLSDENIRRMKESGVKVVSISLDAASGAIHDKIRGVENHFEQTVKALYALTQAGITVQVNTVVMPENVHELPALVKILKETGVSIWEVFFLVSVGRGKAAPELSPAECQDVAHFLYDASRYDLIVRTVEAPYFRCVVNARNANDVDHADSADSADDANPANLANLANSAADSADDIAAAYGLGSLYRQLSTELRERMGDPRTQARSQSSKTRDGKGIIFVSHDGDVYPSGFLPIPLGNIREKPLATIYRENDLLRDIRSAHFHGPCGTCEYREDCGGSRSRSFAATGDALGSDPACPFPPTHSGHVPELVR